MADAYFIIGYAGFGLLLIAYALNLFEKIRQDRICFNVLNFFGALLLVVYTRALDGTLFPLLLGVWGLVAVYGIVSGVKQSKNTGRGKK